jgi:hypothetical protein
VGQFPVTQPYYGFSHTTGYPQQFPGPFAPVMAAGFPSPLPGLTAPWGLSHTTQDPLEGLAARPLWVDPVLATRMAQTFPYLQTVIPPAFAL